MNLVESIKQANTDEEARKVVEEIVDRMIEIAPKIMLDALEASIKARKKNGWCGRCRAFISKLHKHIGREK